MIDVALERKLWQFNATMMPEGFYVRADTYPPLPRVDPFPPTVTERRFTVAPTPKFGNRKQRRKAEAKSRKSRG